MTRVVLADGHRLHRTGIKMLLQKAAAIEVVGEASGRNELAELLAGIPAGVVLLDVDIPEKNALDTLRDLKQQHPHIKVLILSMLDHEHHVHQMMRSGASGYLSKNVSQDELISAIQLVAGGTPYICSDIAIDLLKRSYPAEAPAAMPGIPEKQAKELTKRELEVLDLIAEGYTNAEIAEKLFTSKRTIETHRQNLLEKTQTKNTAMLIRFAFQNGIIS